MHENLTSGVSIFNYINPAEHQFMRKRIEKALGGKIIEFEKSFNLPSKTKWINYIIEPVYNAFNEVNGCVICGTDITSKKETEIEDANYMSRINELFEETQQSLSYASYIQRAIFPNNLKVSGLFEDSFILFRSKEKVSGDFYWMCDLGKKSILILGDCTGHGVPGALLTTISIVLLEQIVKHQHVYSPARILSELNRNIVKLLNQNNGGIMDGMEMAICLFDKRNKMLEFAGAKRSILVVKGSEIIEIKGDRLEVGGGDMKKFTGSELRLTSGSAFYLFSDGFTDQIGGPRNKKFMKSNLKELILTINELNMSEQKTIFEKTFLSWKGHEEQTDDVLLIGARI